MSEYFVFHGVSLNTTAIEFFRTSPKELQVLRRHSQKVYASPSRRKMDMKGDSEEITYPNICFMVDNFDEIFKDILVRDGEMVCVELVVSSGRWRIATTKSLLSSLESIAGERQGWHGTRSDFPRIDSVRGPEESLRRPTIKPKRKGGAENVLWTVGWRLANDTLRIRPDEGPPGKGTRRNGGDETKGQQWSRDTDQ